MTVTGLFQSRVKVSDLGESEEGKARELLSQLVKGRACFSPRNFLCAQFGHKSVTVIQTCFQDLVTTVNSNVA